jgi:uncharacterized phage protein (TIGR02218 family)
MRALEPGFKAHIESGATTLANAWRIIRSDGAVLGFTDHDEVLAFDGTTFYPAHGLDGGEVAQKLGPQTDTSEVVGVLHSEAISEADILLGRFDGAMVESWRVNWRDADMRQLMRRTTIGEITREDGVFRAELRSAQHGLNVARGRIYQSLCDAHLGDTACGVDVDAPAYRGTGAVAAVEDRFRLVIAGVGGFAEGWFGMGHLVWADGQRLGLRDAVLTHTRVGGADVFGFGVPVGDWVSAGDGFEVFAGCDRRYATCRSKFSNGVNFRGFPHIPGSDFVLRYPKKGERLDGRALLK